MKSHPGSNGLPSPRPSSGASSKKQVGTKVANRLAALRMNSEIVKAKACSELERPEKVAKIIKDALGSM